MCVCLIVPETEVCILYPSILDTEKHICSIIYSGTYIIIFCLIFLTAKKKYFQRCHTGNKFHSHVELQTNINPNVVTYANLCGISNDMNYFVQNINKDMPTLLIQIPGKNTRCTYLIYCEVYL